MALRGRRWGYSYVLYPAVLFETFRSITDALISTGTRMATVTSAATKSVYLNLSGREEGQGGGKRGMPD